MRLAQSIFFINIKLINYIQKIFFNLLKITKKIIKSTPTMYFVNVIFRGLLHFLISKLLYNLCYIIHKELILRTKQLNQYVIKKQ